MSVKITLTPKVQLGVVTTHFKFVGGIVPDDNGKFPRDADGSLRVLKEMKLLCDVSPVKMSIVQIPFFASADEEMGRWRCDGSGRDSIHA